MPSLPREFLERSKTLILLTNVDLLGSRAKTNISAIFFWRLVDLKLRLSKAGEYENNLTY